MLDKGIDRLFLVRVTTSEVNVPSKIQSIALWFFLAVWCSGCDMFDRWDAIVYPNRAIRSESLDIGTFGSLEACREAALAKLLPRISNPPIIDQEVEQLDPADLFACAVEIASFFMTRDELAASRTT